MGTGKEETPHRVSRKLSEPIFVLTDTIDMLFVSRALRDELSFVDQRMTLVTLTRKCKEEYLLVMCRSNVAVSYRGDFYVEALAHSCAFL